MNVKHIAATLAILGSTSFALTGCKKESTETPAGDSAHSGEGSCSADKKAAGEASCSGSKTDAPGGDPPADAAGGDPPAGDAAAPPAAN